MYITCIHKGIEGSFSEIIFSQSENANENAFLVLSIQTIYVGMKLKKLIIN